MAELHPNPSGPTAIDDVRRVRDKIARDHGGDLHKHVEETNRIAAEIQARLKVKIVAPPTPRRKRAGTGG